MDIIQELSLSNFSGMIYNIQSTLLNQKNNKGQQHRLYMKALCQENKYFSPIFLHSYIFIRVEYVGTVYDVANNSYTVSL